MNLTRVLKEHLEVWPNGRSGHCMCVDENYLYVYGGYNAKDNHAIYTDLWRYNTSTSKWSKLPDLECMAPKSCLSSSMVLLGSNIIVFGGTAVPFGETNSSDLSLYCLKSFKWFDLNKISQDERLINNVSMNEIKVKDCGCMRKLDVSPTSKYGQSMMVSSDHKLFIFAGTTGNHFRNELHSFCLRKKYWTAYQFCSLHKVHQPAPRYRQEVISTNKEFFIFGGATQDKCFNFNKIQSFDYKEMCWNEIQCTSNTDRFPLYRQSHTCNVFDNRVYMLGGLSQEVILNDIWILDLQKMHWSICVEKLPYFVYFHCASITPHGCMYVFGGTNGDKERVSDLHFVWLNVPPLKRLAWLQLVKMLQNNDTLCKEALVTLGVPKCLLHWIDDVGD